MEEETYFIETRVSDLHFKLTPDLDHLVLVYLIRDRAKELEALLFLSVPTGFLLQAFVVGKCCPCSNQGFL